MSMRNDLAEILFQVFLQEDLVSSSGKGRDVRSLALFIQHFLCRPRRRPPSMVPCRMVLERLSWRVTSANHSIFRFLTVARRGSCGHTTPTVTGLVLQEGNEEKFPQALKTSGLKRLNPFLMVDKQGPCLTAVKEDGNDKRLVQIEVGCLFSLAKAAFTEATLIEISADKVLSLHSIASKYLKLVTFSNFWQFVIILH